MNLLKEIGILVALALWAVCVTVGAFFVGIEAIRAIW